MKLIMESWRHFLNEKLVLKPGPDGWERYGELVTEAYEAAPTFDEAAASAFEALEPFINKMFKRISSRVEVQFVDEDPYAGAEEMCADALNNGILKIWSGGTEHQVFEPELNLKLRAVHDYMTHCQRGTDFTLKGEIASYNDHMKTVPPSAAGALFTEVVGQAAYFLNRGEFPPQKIAILPGFDFFNVGEVDPEITGYELDPIKKELVKTGKENSELDPEVINMIEEYVELPIKEIHLSGDNTILVYLAEEYDLETMDEINEWWSQSDYFKEIQNMGYTVRLLSSDAPTQESSVSLTKELL